MFDVSMKLSIPFSKSAVDPAHGKHLPYSKSTVCTSQCNALGWGLKKDLP